MKKYMTQCVVALLMVGCTTTICLALSRQDMEYGNYCGTGTENLTRPPVDALDALCKAHDECCSCGSRHGLNTSKMKITVCPIFCNNKLLDGLNHFINSNCSLKKISKGVMRAKLCTVARAGKLYSKSIGASNPVEAKECLINQNDSTKAESKCTQEFKSCLQNSKWPSNKQLELD